jgi:hypothetical protein
MDRLAMDPARLASPFGEVPPALARITLRLMEKTPDRRYLDANEILAEISRATGRSIPPETPETKEGRILSGRFVGREEEMETLTGRLLRGKRGAPTLMLITGEGGVGKTRLMREFRVHAQVEGWRCLTGENLEGGTKAMQPLADMLDDLLRILGTSHPLVRKFAGSLFPLLPEELSGDGALEALEGQEGKVRLLDSLAEFIVETSRTAPMVLFLDDLQWADRSILEALGFLVRRARMARNTPPGGPRFLMVGSLRSEAPPPVPLPEILSGLREDGALAEINLGELSRGSFPGNSSRGSTMRAGAIPSPSRKRSRSSPPGEASAGPGRGGFFRKPWTPRSPSRQRWKPFSRGGSRTWERRKRRSFPHWPSGVSPHTSPPSPPSWDWKGRVSRGGLHSS